MMMRKLYRRLSLTAAMLFMFASVLLAQERTVSGTVTDESGSGMPGVNVLVKGTSNGTATDSDGNFKISVGSDQSTLLFTFVGYATAEIIVGSRSVVNVQLTPDVQTLTELVVTGYTVEKKADIIGSVAVVSSKDLAITPTANLSNQLQGRASGVIVSGGGEPGSSAKVRIRGFTSFGRSNPLYVIDGVPTQDASRVNPGDIESIQVLKDATAASIYGSRAAAGVIIITTKQGKPGQLSVTYDGYVGTSFIPENTFPDLINTEEYTTYLDNTMTAGSTHTVFGNEGSLSIPDYMVVAKGTPQFKGVFPAGAPEVDPSLYSVPADDYSDIYTIAKVSPGTNWFKEATRKGIIQNHQLTISGGSDKSTYSVGFNYFDQEGAFVYSEYNRYALRANTSFKVNDFFKVGENLQIINESFVNAGTNGSSVRGEASAWAQSFRMMPYIPVHDIGGGWGGNGIGDSGNGTNPVAQLYRDKDDTRMNTKLLGNVYAEINPIKDLTFRTSFGLEYGNFFTKDIAKRTYERAENVENTGLYVNSSYGFAWTWTNTLTYNKTFGDHTVKLLAGTEAIKANGDGIETQNVNTFDFEDPLFVSLDTDLAAGSGAASTQGTISTLASLFGRVDYSFKDKYLFNATIRRDGYSGFAPENRYATFPAFGLGWRISSESFMSGVDVISDLKIRAGWGQMGSQNNVDPQNSFSTFGTHPGLANYDISRSQNSLAVGYAPTFYGSSTTKWETSESTNVGFDASLLQGKFDVSFSYFNTKTTELLVNKQRNGLEPQGDQPRVNLGEMSNKGFEFDITNRGDIINDLKYTATLTFTSYKNEVVDIDGNPLTFIAGNASRINNVTRTTPGQPISSFYGYEIDGFFNDQADLDAVDHPDERIGTWRFKDQNGDDIINEEDKVFLGNPQPDFILGLNLGLTYKAFDLTAFFVWNQGNEIFNYTKYFTEMRGFPGGVSKRVIYDGWTPEDHSAALPYLAPGGASGYTPTVTSQSLSYYVEDGSYLRGKTLQLGYTLPTNIASKVKLSRARVYFQAQNFFTITGYSGADPDIGIQGGDINSSTADLYMGVDETSTPNPRQFIFGLNLGF